MPKKADPELVAQTVEKVRRVALEIGYTGEHGEAARLAKELDRRGMKTPSGGQWHYDVAGPLGLTRFIKKHMREGLPGRAKVDKLDQANVRQESDDKYDNVDKREVESMLQSLEARLTTLIEKRFSEAVTAQGVTVDKVDMPPVPPKVGEAGKKFAGSKSDLRARVDSNLFERLESEAQAHFSGNMSRCLDVVLWRYFGKPRLSFED
ncbi:MAG: hypothetical protein AB1733_06275 [Thermodesulfobacteriota bacterium]